MADKTFKSKELHEKFQEDPVLRSDELFSGKRKLWIEHGEERYCLMITKTGKLILNK